MSFQALLKRLSGKLKRISYRLGERHFSNFDAADLFQEALLHLWQEYSCGSLDDKTDSYILQGCYFHLKNYIRKTRDKAYLLSIDAPLKHDEEGQPVEAFSPQEPHSLIEEVNNRNLIGEILNDGLTKREREVFSLLLEGHTVREIGRILGVSHVSVVKSGKKIKDKCRKFKDSF